MEAYHILIVEDDKEILDGVGIYMKNQGYEVFKAQNGLEGLKILEKEEIHLAIIDIMMPVMDGITMTMKLREHYDFPVIMLSAKSEEIDKVTGLNIGADDYVTKPFAPMELMARVNSQLRRYSRYLKLAAGSRTEEPKEHFYAVGGLELNEDTVEVSVDGNPVTLTPLEFKILALLMRNPGRVFSPEEIYERIWNEKPIGTETIMVHIRNIRTKQIAERILQGVPRSPLQNHYGIPASGNIEDPPDKTLPLRAFPDEPSAVRPHLQRLSPGPSDFPFPAQECRS